MGGVCVCVCVEGGKRACVITGTVTKLRELLMLYGYRCTISKKYKRNEWKTARPAWGNDALRTPSSPLLYPIIYCRNSVYYGNGRGHHNAVDITRFFPNVRGLFSILIDRRPFAGVRLRSDRVTRALSRWPAKNYMEIIRNCPCENRNKSESVTRTTDLQALFGRHESFLKCPRTVNSFVVFITSNLIVSFVTLLPKQFFHN